MEETKRCPYCGEEILAVAKKCKHCGEWLEIKEPEKEKKACPVCGELVDVDVEVCPYCKEPVREENIHEAKSVLTVQVSQSDNTVVTKSGDNVALMKYVKLAFWAVVIGRVLSYANYFAQEYSSETGGLIELFVGFCKNVPSWIGLFLDGVGFFYLLWSVANMIGHQKKASGIEDDGMSFLLKSLAVLYFAINIISCFINEGVLAGIGILLAVLKVILIVINGFVLKSEENSELSGMGYAFITYVIVVAFMLKSFKYSYDPEIFLLLVFISDIAWVCAMYAAHSFLLKNK